MQRLIAASVNKLVTEAGTTKLPLSDRSLFELKKSALEKVDELMSKSCSYCMDLAEFLQTQREVHHKMEEVFAEVDKDNAKNSQAINKDLSLSLLEPTDASIGF